MPIYPYSFTMPPVNKQDIPSDGVVGEFLGISAGGVLDWLPVSASVSGDMLKSENLSGLANYAIARTNIGLGLTSSPEFANLTLTSPSLASSAPVTISQTWNGTGSTVFTALKVNATTPGTTSSSSSLLLDLQVGGVSKFYVSKTGAALIPEIGMDAFHYFQIGSGLPLTIGTYHGVRIRRDSTSSQAALLITTPSTGTGDLFRCSTLDGGGVVNGNPFTIAFDGSLKIGGTDTILLRDGAPNTLALRNGTSAQTFNVYGTYTSITDYRRLSISVDNTTGLATIATNKGSGTTTGDTDLKLQASSGSYLQIRSTGRLIHGTPGSNIFYPGGNNYVISSRDALGGSTNTGMGFQVFESLATGTLNVAFGLRSLGASTTANNTIALGYQAGYLVAADTNNTVCDNSIFIGNETRAALSGETNQIVIGHDARGIGSNSVVLGNNSITKTALKGNVGIGTTAPGSALTISGALGSNTTTYDSAAALKLTNTTGNTSWLLTSGVIGVVNASFSIRQESSSLPALVISNLGNVGIGTTSPTSKLHVEDATSPTLTIKNTSATGYSQVLLANTVVPGSGFWVNGSAQVNYGGASSFNIYAAASNIAFHTASVTNALSIAQSGAATFAGQVVAASFSGGGIVIANNQVYRDSSSVIGFPSNGVIRLSNFAATDFNLLQLGGGTDSFPALKRSTTRIQAVLATTSTTFTNIQGKLTTDTDYTATVVTPTGFLTLYDAQGTAYRVPCVLAP